MVSFSPLELSISLRLITQPRKKSSLLVFVLDKFHSYVLGSPITVFTNHSDLKYLMTKNESKPRLVRWDYAPSRFDLTIKSNKGTKNSAADHLSKILQEEDHVPLREDFQTKLFSRYLLLYHGLPTWLTIWSEVNSLLICLLHNMLRL